MIVKNILKAILPKIIFEFGVYWYKSRHNKSLESFEKDFKLFSSKISDNRFICNWSDTNPCLKDAIPTTPFEPHYTYHPAWASRILAKTKPEKHIDIASSTQFIVVASAFVPIEFYDYRPAPLSLSGLECEKGDLTALPFSDNSINSLSCMHVVEHIGLGRYGDPIDPQGDIKAMSELSRVVAKGGQLLFVVPIGGKAKIEFNAHRIYTYDIIINAFSNLKLENFALITDAQTYNDNSNKEESDKQKWGCGCFHFRKI
jgi:hypothetical protein